MQKGTDRVSRIAGLMLGPTHFWGRCEEGARAAIRARSTDLGAARVSRQQAGEQPASDPYGTPQPKQVKWVLKVVNLLSWIGKG